MSYAHDSKLIVDLDNLLIWQHTKTSVKDKIYLHRQAVLLFARAQTLELIEA